MSAWVGEVMAALRLLLRSPTFTMACVLSLALGIGASVPILTIARALAGQPSIHDPGSAIRVFRTVGTDSSGGARVSEVFGISAYRALQGNPGPLVALGAEVEWTGTMGDFRPRLVLDDDGAPLAAIAVTGKYFEVLGVPIRGPGLHVEDSEPGSAPAVILSDAVWNTRGRRANVAPGTDVRIAGTPVRLAGVAPPGFRGVHLGEWVDAWIPIGTLPWFSPVTTSDLRFTLLRIYGRARPGVAVPEIDAHVKRVLGPGAFVRTLADATYGREFAQQEHRDRRVVGFLAAISAVVLLLACTNVASLLLARAHIRRRETAVRLSLGCSRGHFVRLLGAEALWLAALGTIAGLILAKGVLWALRDRALPSSLEIADLPGMDAASVAAAVIAGAMTTVIYTLVPAAVAFRTRPALLHTDTAPAIRRGVGAGPLLLGLHVALTVLLLVGALLVGRSLQRSLAVDVGFDVERTLQVGVRPSVLAYRQVVSDDQFLDRRRADYRRLMDSLRQMPGVVTVATGRLPLAAHVDGQAIVEARSQAFEVEGRTLTMPVAVKSGGPGIVTALGLGLVEGRDFREEDLGAPDPVGILNGAAARALFGQISPIGRLVTLPGAAGASRVVGVVEDAAHVSLRSARPPTVYAIEDLPSHEGEPDFLMIVRTAGPPDPFKVAIARIVSSNFPHVTSLDLTTGRDALRAQVRDQAFGATVSSWYGAMALLIALIGVQSSVTVMIVSRRRELAIRMALGATGATVVRLVSGRALAPVAFGIVVGIVASGLSARTLQAYLFGISPFDWTSYVAVAVAVLAVAGLQAVVASRPVLALDPARTLRSDVVT